MTLELQTTITLYSVHSEPTQKIEKFF